MDALNQNVVDQHAHSASVLWLRRDRAVCAPHFRLDDLVTLDEELDAHLDGLRIAGEGGWKTCVDELQWREPGEVFMAAVLALESDDTGRIEVVLNVLDAESSLLRAFVSAGGWVAFDKIQDVVETFWSSEDWQRRYLALSICAIHRVELPGMLESASTDNSQCVRDRSVRAAKELGHKLPDESNEPIDMSNREGFWAAGMSGKIDVIPELLKSMVDSKLARASGEAFSMITGVDLVDQNLSIDQPDDFESTPNEDPGDENVVSDPDEDLPWPNHPKISQWWTSNKSRFETSTRYFVGQPLAEEWLDEVLRLGYQRQRTVAAVELAKLRPSKPIFNVKAPGFRQKKWLGIK